MKLSLLAAVAGLVLVTGVAQAQVTNQVGIYVTPIVSRISNNADTGVFAFLGPNKTSQIFAGFGMGFYDSFSHTPSIDAGIDVRGDFLQGNGAHLSSFLVGPRVSFKPVRYGFKPYVEAMIGVGRSRPAHTPASLGRLQYGAAVGADYAIASHVDFRVLEIGYGAVETISSSTYNGNTNPSTSQQISFRTGLVFRFP
jgi:hypothetical protein